MANLDFQTLQRRLHEGKNPVELAGYGRESTHKGYLTWMLDTGRWRQAREAIQRLVHVAWTRKHRPRTLTADGGPQAWWEAPEPPTVPASFWTEFERPLGKRKVDLMIMTNDGGTKKVWGALELKTDSPPGKNQFVKMSKCLEGKPALVINLGSMSVRDDGSHTGGYADFAVIRPRDILEAWTPLDKPTPVAQWLEALAHEVWRLENAFHLTRAERKSWWIWGYRSPKHLHYALLQAVRENLHRRHPDIGTWQLFDGGHNTVLNLQRCPYSWIALKDHPGLTAYWEFNDRRLMLKVKREEDPTKTRAWIRTWQNTAKRQPCRWPMELPGALRASATWISVMTWEVPDDSPDEMADAAVAVIRQFTPLLEGSSSSQAKGRAPLHSENPPPTP